MTVAHRVLPNLYRDSVALMRLAADMNGAPGVEQASAAMATEANLSLLRESGLLDDAAGAGPNDLLLVAKGASGAELEAALDAAERALKQAAPSQAAGRAEMAPRSLQMALERMPGAQVALISTPGEYAAAEALKALRLGLHVMLFSDNVSEEAEIALKRFARERGLLVMGPDCGTAVVNGIPLGFANVVRRGPVGVVGASGTGTQQVTCLIDRLGSGVSQAIGTGGRDLHADVEGMTMIQALEMLGADPATRVIAIISKPPSAAIAERVMKVAREIGKPVVVNFLGLDAGRVGGRNLHAAGTLEDAALAAVRLAGASVTSSEASGLSVPFDAPREAAREKFSPKPSQRFVRGLFSGGTFCYEALLLLSETLGEIRSNIPLDKRLLLQDVWRSEGHTAIDLGDDRFTRGRPHPMIDHRLRNERIVLEADDPGTAVILLDVVLGYGSHADPAAEMAPALAEARRRAEKAGRDLAFVASVCGTAGDPQNLARQEAALRAAGVRIAASNARAARLAAALVQGGGA